MEDPFDEVQKVHQIFDMSDATDEELAALTRALRVTLEEVLQIAVQRMESGQFHGCVHTHLEMAVLELQSKFPCDDCAVEIPPSGELN